MTKFLELAANNKTKPHNMSDFIENYHTSAELRDAMTIYEFLGLTQKQWNELDHDPTLLVSIINEYREENGIPVTKFY